LKKTSNLKQQQTAADNTSKLVKNVKKKLKRLQAD